MEQDELGGDCSQYNLVTRYDQRWVGAQMRRTHQRCREQASAAYAIQE